MMASFSSAYIPLFGAFVIAVNASLNEEIIFRLFGISFAKKYLHNLAAAILVTAVIWGMGHTMYAIFPVWFRIIEISIIGIFYGFIFIRFGIIPLIVAHYLFDAFWCTAAYLLGQSSAPLFYTAIGLLCIPLFWAAGAYFFNRTQEERPVRYVLDRVQEYNLGVLTAFIAAKKAEGFAAQRIEAELLNNNWDHLMVKLAIAEVFKA